MSGEPKAKCCPFPNACTHWCIGIPGDCKVWKDKPVILCSLQASKEAKVELSEIGIREYLDRHIAIWHAKAETLKAPYAVLNRDAYQKLRKDLLGEELKFGKLEAESDE